MTSTAFPHLLFSYGTLQNEDVQLASFGRRLNGTEDAIVGYRKEMLEITDAQVLRLSGEQFHPIVVPSDNEADKVAGTVFKISQAELEAADRYEVADYMRVLARLASGNQAWVYVQKSQS